MNLNPRWKFVAAALALVLTLPLAAEKRRSVRHPSPGNSINVKIKGTVLDATTNNPVPFAEITVADQGTFADRLGKFTIQATVSGIGNVTVGRSGYNTQTQQVSTAGDHDLTFRLTPKPTVRLRLTNGTTHDIDFETVEFGYVPPFGSYVKSASEDFCRANGEKVTIDRTQMKRITGPAVSEQASACCAHALAKMNVELKNGTTAVMYFMDTCDAQYSVDFIGRDHATGDFVYAKTTNIAEIVFP